MDACVLPYSALVKNTDGAGLRVIAMQCDKPLPLMPNVGTTGAQGYPELDGNDQIATLSAPAATPAPVLRKLEDAVRTAMNDPAVMKNLNELEVQPRFVDAAGARQWLEGDVKKLTEVIKAAGLAGQ